MSQLFKWNYMKIVKIKSCVYNYLYCIKLIFIQDFKPNPRNSFRPIDDDFSDDDDPALSSVSNGSSSPTPSMMAKMTHKDTIATVARGGCRLSEKGNISEALNLLNEVIDPSAKILYDIGVLQKAMGPAKWCSECKCSFYSVCHDSVWKLINTSGAYNCIKLLVEKN